MCVQPTKPIKWLLYLLLTSMSTGVHALTTDVEQPVQIEADQAVFDKSAGTATYSGNVIIRQGTLEIFASNIQINAPDNEIKNITATGKPVSLKQKMDNGKLATGQANEMQYFVKDKRLILNGNAQLTQIPLPATILNICLIVDNSSLAQKVKQGVFLPLSTQPTKPLNEHPSCT